MFTTMILGGIVLLVARVGATLRRRRAPVELDDGVPTPGSTHAPDAPVLPDKRRTAGR